MPARRGHRVVRRAIHRSNSAAWKRQLPPSRKAGIAPRFANLYSVEGWHSRYCAASRMVRISPFRLAFAFNSSFLYPFFARGSAGFRARFGF